MAGKTAVFAIYKTDARAKIAFSELTNAGFRPSDISVLTATPKSAKDFAHEKHTKAPEGTVTGGATGAVAGGIVGWLAGIGAIAVPGAGPFVAAGPVMATLAGVGVGGTAGAIVGALIGLGIPEYEAKRFEGLIKKGGVLLSVHSENSESTSRAKHILEDTCGEGIGTRGEASADVRAEGPSSAQNF